MSLVASPPSEGMLQMSPSELKMIVAPSGDQEEKFASFVSGVILTASPPPEGILKILPRAPRSS